MVNDYTEDTATTIEAYLVALLPKPMAFLSMVGSYISIREVLVDHKLKRGKAIPRTLLALSVSDIVFSFGWFLTT